MVRIRFGVWFLSGYAHIGGRPIYSLLLSVVVVPYPVSVA